MAPSDGATRDTLTEPLRRILERVEEAREAGVPEPTAMALATATPDGRPSVRMVLLKGLDERGLVFYTNLQSRKARELEANPHAALCFHWQPLEIQVRVEGPVQPVSDEEADAYFESRPRGSRIGAWASRQSEPLEGPEVLEAAIHEIGERYGDGAIPRPPFWSGYRLAPERVEFWTARPDRLHLREVFEREMQGGEWSRHLLQP
jgi:pyridoxamine 5'-phosphate oxidase